MKVCIIHSGNNRVQNHEEELMNLEDFMKLEDSSCKSINMNNVLDYVSYENRNNLLTSIVKKLRLNGKLIISGIDYSMLINNVSSGVYSIEVINKLWMNGRMSCNVAFNIEETLHKLGLVDISIKFESLNYFIIARRPKSCQM